MKFTYTALSKDGKSQTGEIDSESTVSAGHQLKEQGLVPTEIRELKPRLAMDFFSGLQGVKLSEKIVFIQDLSIMLKSGIPVVRCLRILEKQTENKKFAKILSSVCQAVENGTSLYEALGKFPLVFSPIFVSMIKVGELSGNLDQSLQYLKIQLEREADLKSHVRGAMIYPVVIVITMVIITIVMSIFVLPKLTSVFKEFNQQLPFMTRVVVGLSDFMAGHAILVVLGLLVAGAGIILFLRTSVGKRSMYTAVLYFPIINTLVTKINLARFSRVFSSLLKSGIPIVEGLAVAGESIPNMLFTEVINTAAEGVKVGKPLTQTLEQYPRLFPFIVTQMLEVGEETGSLENILEQLAGHFEEEVDATLKNFSSIIEPILLLVIGGVVGLLAYALIIPIYSIGTAIQ